jgi:hypothetical protein
VPSLRLRSARLQSLAYILLLICLSAAFLLPDASGESSSSIIDALKTGELNLDGLGGCFCLCMHVHALLLDRPVPLLARYSIRHLARSSSC